MPQQALASITTLIKVLPYELTSWSAASEEGRRVLAPPFLPGIGAPALAALARAVAAIRMSISLTSPRSDAADAVRGWEQDECGALLLVHRAAARCYKMQHVCNICSKQPPFNTGAMLSLLLLTLLTCHYDTRPPSRLKSDACRRLQS